MLHLNKTALYIYWLSSNIFGARFDAAGWDTALQAEG